MIEISNIEKLTNLAFHVRVLNASKHLEKLWQDIFQTDDRMKIINDLNKNAKNIMYCIGYGETTYYYNVSDIPPYSAVVGMFSCVGDITPNASNKIFAENQGKPLIIARYFQGSSYQFPETRVDIEFLMPEK